MKKIIIIFFFFLSIIICYFVYQLTETEDICITSIGDTISKNMYIKDNDKHIRYDYNYTNKNYRIIDLQNIIKYNEEKYIANTKKSIHQILNKTDILILSIGMNDIYFKLNSDSKEIYTYINGMLNNYDYLLNLINKYDYRQVFILGYYNIYNKNNDIYTYANYKLKKLATKYHYIYLDLNKIFRNHPEYLQKPDNFYPNALGYYKINELIVEKMKYY